ncbi:MAG: beta-glucosidase, partial [Janthinobacterium lividum]
HLIEARRGKYDFSSLLPQVAAARDVGVQVIWDLFHYGLPNGVDIWGASFVDRFAAFARAVAAFIRTESDGVPFYVPINEISFFAWGAGDVAYLNPFARGRGGELKAILVRATIAAIEAIRDVEPRARFALAEPLINILPQSDAEEHVAAAANYMESQFEAVDMLAGKLHPELGGGAQYLDLVGLNCYYNNQWIDHGRTVYLGDPLYRPLRELLELAQARVDRPIFIAETGTEGGGRAPWLHYVADEVAAAMAAGRTIEGICIYPILSHVGWDNDRHCHNGMIEAFNDKAPRTVFKPLANELARQQALFAEGNLARE